MIAVRPVKIQPIVPVKPRHEAHPVVLDVQDVTVQYRGNTALESVRFCVRAGEMVAIIGANGAGKSTLIKTIMGLIQPRSGFVRLNGSASRLGYVPQNEGVDWEFPVTVRDVVMMGCIRDIGWLRRPRPEHRAIVVEALERVGMSAFADRQVGELSGGQRRRVFIARALAQRADILILDEPFSGVDAAAQAELMDVLDKLNADGLTILLSTHDLDMAYRRFDKVLALNRRAIAYGTPDEVYTPDTLAALFGRKITMWDNGKPVRAWMDDCACGKDAL